MIDTISNTINFSSIWQFVGPLVGVGFGYLISYKVWNRQRQWELKRDVVFDVIRAQYDVIESLKQLALAYAKSPSNIQTEDLNLKLKHLEEYRFTYLRAREMTDLIIGGELSIKLLKQAKLFDDARKEQQNILLRSEGEVRKEVLLAARAALGIKDAGDVHFRSEHTDL